MEKTMKFLGIIALVAVIGFSMAACDNSGGGGGGDGFGSLPGAFQGIWKWDCETDSGAEGHYGHTITITISSTSYTQVEAGDPGNGNGTLTATIQGAKKTDTVQGFTMYDVKTEYGIKTVAINAAGTQAVFAHNDNGTPRIFTKQGNVSGTVPAELQGTWKWDRNDGSGHNIVWTLTSSTNTVVETNEHNGNDGTVVFTVTNVTKGSTSGGWTTYTSTVTSTATGAMTVTFQLNAAKDQIRDNNSNGNNDGTFPRIYHKQGNSGNGDSDYAISLDPSDGITFTAATVGYGSQMPEFVYVENTGNQPTGVLTIALSGTNASSFTLSTQLMDSLDVYYSRSFTVVPKTGLTISDYSAIVTVSGGNGISGQINVSFTVRDYQDPAADDFNFYRMEQKAWGVYHINIQPKEGKSWGNTTIYYEGTATDGTGYTKSTTPPQKDGTYAVTFDVEAYGDWNAATGLSAGDLVIIVDPDIGLSWTAASTSTTDSFYDIAYGGGRFVAVGSFSQMRPSTNGINWDSVETKPFNDHFLCIAYGGGKFVVSGEGGGLGHSDDGINWTAVEDSPGSSRGIAYGGGKFVACGSGGKMAHSDDGINWTAVNDSQYRGLSAIAYGGGKFVAVGSDCNIAYSTDGVSWEWITVDELSYDYFGYTIYPYIYGIAYGDGKFVACGSGGKMAHSTDGIDWTVVGDSKFGVYDDIYGIAYGGGKFVACGSGGKMAHSTDGINWTAVGDSEFGATNNTIYGIAYGGGRFVAVGQNGKIRYSP